MISDVVWNIVEHVGHGNMSNNYVSARVFTIWMDSADILLLGNFIISVLLSSSIMFSALYYRSRPLKQD